MYAAMLTEEDRESYVEQIDSRLRPPGDFFDVGRRVVLRVRTPFPAKGSSGQIAREYGGVLKKRDDDKSAILIRREDGKSYMLLRINICAETGMVLDSFRRPFGYLMHEAHAREPIVEPDKISSRQLHSENWGRFVAQPRCRQTLAAAA